MFTELSPELCQVELSLHIHVIGRVYSFVSVFVAASVILSLFIYRVEEIKATKFKRADENELCGLCPLSTTRSNRLSRCRLGDERFLLCLVLSTFLLESEQVIRDD